MDDSLFKMIIAIIPVIGAIITGFIIPYLKTKISCSKLDEISQWVTNAVQAAEMLFDTPNSGEEKREYVTDFIDKIFNSKKEIITKDQIRVLIEAVCSRMSKT